MPHIYILTVISAYMLSSANVMEGVFQAVTLNRDKPRLSFSGCWRVEKKKNHLHDRGRLHHPHLPKHHADPPRCVKGELWHRADSPVQAQHKCNPAGWSP